MLSQIKYGLVALCFLSFSNIYAADDGAGAAFPDARTQVPQFRPLPYCLKEAGHEFRAQIDPVLSQLSTDNPFRQYTEWMVYQDGLGVSAIEQDTYKSRNADGLQSRQSLAISVETIDDSGVLSADGSATRAFFDVIDSLFLPNNPFANHLLGVVYARGIGKPQNLQKALSYFNSACQFDGNGERILGRPAPYKRTLELLQRNYTKFQSLRGIPELQLIEREIGIIDTPLKRLQKFFDQRQSAGEEVSSQQLFDLESCLTYYPEYEQVLPLQSFYQDINQQLWQTLKEEKAKLTAIAGSSISAREIGVAVVKLAPPLFVTSILLWNAVRGFDFTASNYITNIFTCAFVSTVNTIVPTVEAGFTLIPACIACRKRSQIAPIQWINFSDDILQREAKLISLYITLLEYDQIRTQRDDLLIPNTIEKLMNYLKSTSIDSDQSLARNIHEEVTKIFPEQRSSVGA